MRRNKLCKCRRPAFGRAKDEKCGFSHGIYYFTDLPVSVGANYIETIQPDSVRGTIGRDNLWNRIKAGRFAARKAPQAAFPQQRRHSIILHRCGDRDSAHNPL